MKKITNVSRALFTLGLAISFAVPNVFAAVQPSIDSIIPASGPSTGGTSVTINGQHLGSVTVSIGGIAATNVVIAANSQSLTATTPAGTAGAKDVVVTNGNGSATLVGGFTYVGTSQTITFNSLSGKTYGDADFSVSATATSGLTPTFTSSTTPVCTVSGSTVHIVAAGSCTIMAYQAGNGTYSAATPVSQSFTIAKATPTILVTPYSVTYDGASHTATGSVTGAFAELLAGLDLTGTTHTTVGVYSDSWTFTDATGNYNNANSTVSDTISAVIVVPLSVTITPATGGEVISAATVGGAWTALTDIVVSENSVGAIGEGTIVLDLPTGFEFDLSAPAPTVVVTKLAGNGTDNKNINGLASLSEIPVTATASQLSITVDSSTFGDHMDSLTWKNIRVRPTTASPLGSGNITNSGTASITGVVNGSTNFGTLNGIDDSVSDSSKAITAFAIAGQVGSTAINEGAKTIAVTVPFGTDVTALSPTVTITGASVSPLSATAQDFTSPVHYVVTAADDSTADYTVTVTIAPEGVITHTLSYAAGAHGSLTGATSQTVADGSNGSTVTAVADGGYHFTAWSDAVTANPRTDTNVTGNISVTANFAADAVNPNAPTITLIGNSELIVSVGTAFVDPGATATDVQDGDLTSSIIVTGTVDSATPGNYELTYTVTDSDELSDSTTRMVHVVETLGGAGGSSGIVGCTDPAATNYNAAASVGSTCTYSTVPTGEVLGAATSTTPTAGTTGEVLGASTSTLTCSEYLSLNQGLQKKALREAAKNDPQLVILLQKYLNDYVSANLPLTGYFGPMTTSAVKKLQTLYKDSILAPWKLTKATGVVYITTVAHINNTVCPALDIKVNPDDLVPASR